MNSLLRIIDRLFRKRLAIQTQKHLAEIAEAPLRAARQTESTLWRVLGSEPGAKVHLGMTERGDPVEVPLAEFVHSFGLVHGGTGSGKSMAGFAIAESIISQLPQLRSVGLGVLDAKGELFDRVVYLVARRLAQLEGQAKQELLDRVVIIDFSCREAVTPYNILARGQNIEGDFFVTSRLETLRELLPAQDNLSLRGVGVLKNVLVLLTEFGLPLTYLTRVLGDEPFRTKLLSRSKNTDIRNYFSRHFPQEMKQTIAALHARVDSLLAADGVRLALAGASAPNFKALLDAGAVVLINFAGPSITRGVRLLLQALVLSDIRQAIFARAHCPSVNFLWLADEAQNFFLTRQQKEIMSELLTMARSHGSFFAYFCQNISASVSDSEVLEQLHTNIRWSLTLRGTPHDARFLRAALPLTGRLPRPNQHPYGERTFYSPEEERSLALESIAHLPDQTGYLWLKARCPEAIKIRTQRIELPEAAEFRRIVDELRADPRIGGRIPRASYEQLILERDNEWIASKAEYGDLEARFEKKYREERDAWQS